VVSVCLTNGENEIVVANRGGRAIRFSESTVRTMGRGATGVKAMAIDSEEDEIVGMVCVEEPETQSILVVSEQGYGKRSTVEDYRITNRGGKGVKTLNITEKVGPLIAIRCVTDENDLMIINKSGVTIRLKLSEVSIQGRVTQGVKLINLTKRNDFISNVCVVATEEDEEYIENNEAIEEALPTTEE
jgi:DNA gyrase subunit A